MTTGPAFTAGIVSAMTKTADSVTDAVSEFIDSLAPASAGEGDDVESIWPRDGQLEAVIVAIEDEFGIKLGPKTAFAVFAAGTLSDLKDVVAAEVARGDDGLSKTANHAYYMRNREKIRQRGRQYRMRNLAHLRRRARIYRRRVKRRQIRPRRRVGTRGGGYTFVAR